MRVSSDWRKTARRQAGVSLVEMVIFIMIVSLSVAGILIVMTATTQRSADPMVQQQALLIAESYMEEILHKGFTDPNPGETQVCHTTVPFKETSRASYDNVCDYHNLNDTAGAVDQLGNTVTGLTVYNVSVLVTGDVGDATALGPTVSQATNTGALRVLRVDVEVTHDDTPDFQMRLTGYRTNYYCADSEATNNPGCLPR